MSDAGDEYDQELVTLLQLVWGEGFLAPGGPASVRRTVDGVELAGCRVLDIGCGIGGADLVLAGEFSALVTGLDIEQPLIDAARANAARAGLSDRIEYVRADPGPLPFPTASFDHVFTHAAMIHVPDKPLMFSEIIRVLRPGGRLLAYDWLKGPEPFSADMFRWFELEGLTYVMGDLTEYLRWMAEAGFVEATGEDAHAEYREMAHLEYSKMSTDWYERMADLLGPERRDHFIEDWRALTVVLDNGELRPAYFRGAKPR